MNAGSLRSVPAEPPGRRGFFERLVTHPSQTVVLSFLAAISAGTLLLCIPGAGRDGAGLSLLDSLFTATSAVCVTGLIVVDTAARLSVFGQIVVLVLIQLGGLGIMVLSSFTVFVVRRRASLRHRMLASYVLDRQDRASLTHMLRRIVGITLVAEAAGAVALFIFLGDTSGTPGAEAPLAGRLFSSIFHAVSAFCNAGFSLFSDSLAGYRHAAGVNFAVALLIISGGLSFAVTDDLLRFARQSLRRLRALVQAGREHMRASGARAPQLSVNSRAVLAVTGLLLLLGTLLFYALEHTGVLGADRAAQQYMAAFFQSVTLRTAGFNTVSIGALGPATLCVLCAFMFVGGAAGSTAGGIKVNSVAVLWSYLAGFRRRQRQTVLFRHGIRPEQVMTAFTIVLLSGLAVFTGTILLVLFEGGEFLDYLFEAVSAFGTVGLSTGVTPGLSPGGKLVIIGLMFSGRLGPLTLLAASVQHQRSVSVQYPEAEIRIG